MQYNGKVVIVTGSSSGIGRGTALYFGSQGAKVVLASRNTAANANLKEEIERTGGTAMFVQTDVVCRQIKVDFFRYKLSEC